MFANTGVFLVNALFVFWLATLLALPLVTVVGLVVGNHRPRAGRIIDLTAFGMAVAGAMYIVSAQAVSRLLGVPNDPGEAIGGQVLLIGALALSVPCGLIAARAAVVARRDSEVIASLAE
jgi:hypothetical protein